MVIGDLFAAFSTDAYSSAHCMFFFVICSQHFLVLRPIACFVFLFFRKKITSACCTHFSCVCFFSFCEG